LLLIWNKAKKLGLALLAASFLSVAALGAVLVWWLEYYRAVSFTEVAADRAELIDGIESYQSVAEFVAWLKANSQDYEIEVADTTAGTSNRPPYRNVSIKLVEYEFMEHRGDLFVSFFNDRLMSVGFYPSHPDSFFRSLRANIGLAFGEKEEDLPSPNVRVWIATNHTGQRYIHWSDTHLDDELRLWIKRYS